MYAPSSWRPSTVCHSRSSQRSKGWRRRPAVSLSPRAIWWWPPMVQRFATPGVKIGLFCSTPMVPLSRAIGRKRALEMLLTGQSIAADTALDWGLVNRVVPAEALEDEVSTIVDAIVASSPLSVGLGKEAFYAQIELDEHRAYDLTKAVMAMNARADDAQEGMCAFLEKRPATWSSS